MLEHARRALPWPLLAGLSLVILLMLALLGRWPGPMWSLGGIAAGVLAAGAAWCVDEPVPEICDTVARPLGWRLAARGAGVGLLCAVWLAGTVLLTGDLLGRRADLIAQGFAAVLAVGGVAAWLRGHGYASPGRALAPYVVMIGAGLALARPYPRLLPIFPSLADESLVGSRLLWTALAALGAAGVVLAVAESTWWRATGGFPSSQHDGEKPHPQTPPRELAG
jgi:hypothetical protein